MPFVKLDTGILNSTLWFERECREIFLTALLMAVPEEFTDPQPQIEIRSLKLTGWEVPPGWYGFVASASVGIIHKALVGHEAGLAALDRLGNPEPDSRSADYEGRRLIRVDGGFIVLNYMKYREHDYGAADRMRRYRERKAAIKEGDVTGNNVTLPRNVTHAEAEAEADKEKTKALSGKPDVLAILEFLNSKTGRHYRPVKANLQLIEARLAEGATVDEMMQVIAKKVREWQGNPEMDTYLRPLTLFNRTKFAQYQGELLCVAQTANAS